MTKVREHIVIEPSGDSVDFLRKDLDTSRVWFQHPRPCWVSTLLPAAIAEACSGSNFTYSTWRRFPLRSPDEFTIPSNEGAFLILCLHADRWRVLAHDVDLPYLA